MRPSASSPSETRHEPRIRVTTRWHEILLFVQIVFGGLIGFGPLLYSPGSGEPTAVAQLLYPVRSIVSFAVLGLALLLVRRLPLGRRTWPLLAYLVVLIGSGFWSVDASVTFRASIDMTIVMLSILVLCHRLPLDRIANVIIDVMAFIVLLSCLLALFVPEVGLTSAQQAWMGDQIGAWRGVFVEKNGLGGMSAIATAAMVLMWRHWSRPIALRALALGAALACLAFSRSANAVIGLFAMGLITLLFVGSPSRLRVVANWTAIGLSIPLLATTANLARVLEFIGRDPTLNGRSFIWATSMEVWRQSWLLGRGFAAGTAVYLQPILIQLHGSAARHPHSGYIEVLVETGVVGFIPFAAVVILAMCWLSGSSVRRSKAEGAAASMLLAVLVGSMAMAGGDVLATRLIGGWGVITWATIAAAAVAAPRPVRSARRTRAVMTAQLAGQPSL